MSAKTHLFVAAQKAPFGEAVLGVRIAHELHARGDRVILYARESLSLLTEGTPFRYIPVGENVDGIDRAIAKLAAETHADSIVLLDVTSTYMLLKAQRTDAAFVSAMGVPVIGLDVWNLSETGLEWDMCGTSWQQSRHSLDVKRRLVPVPFAKPTGATGLYNALPSAVPFSVEQREDVRADFGVGKEERLLLLTSARWQHPSMQPHDMGRRLATTYPSLVAELVGRLGTRVRVVHVGPAPYPMADALGDRYTWLPQRSPARFARLLSSADLLVSFNFSATTIVSAVAMGLPVVLGVNSRAGESADAIAATLPEQPSPALHAWLTRTAPLPAFRVWPLGLHRLLAPLVKGNPYTTAIRTAEVLEESAFVEAMRSLLFDEDARAALRSAQNAYRAEVSKLPNAADLVHAYLAGAP